MGLSEDELQPLVNARRSSNPHITQLWWDIDAVVKKAVMYKTAVQSHGFRIYYKSGILFIDLSSGRRLVYVTPPVWLQTGSALILLPTRVSTPASERRLKATVPNLWRTSFKRLAGIFSHMQ